MRACLLSLLLKCAGVLHASCLFCACVWLFLLWRVHAIVCMFCACIVHAWLLHASCLFCACVWHAGWRLPAACDCAYDWCLFCAYHWLLDAPCLFDACVWLFLLVLLMPLLHLMLARASSCCLHAWARCVLFKSSSGVRSSGPYHNMGRHRAFPGCDGSLE